MTKDKQKALSLLRRPNLTKGQKSLYRLVCQKLKDDEMIMFNEAKDIWMTNIAKTIKNGVPYYWNSWKRNEKDETVGGYDPMNEWQVTQYVLIWLTHNIGSLVLKGFLLAQH